MRALVISAHPDDETLGCGGTLLRHRDDGVSLSWLIATRAHEPEWSGEIIERKTAEVECVAEALGVEQRIQLEFPSGRLDTLPLGDLIDGIRSAVTENRPELVYLVHGGDVHTDHQAVFAAAMSVLKPIHMAKLGVRRILCYETLSSTDAAPPLGYLNFAPNVFGDVTSYLDQKINIMSIYETEKHQDPLPRGPSAIRALARYRGASIGVEYAEAFVLMRELV